MAYLSAKSPINIPPTPLNSNPQSNVHGDVPAMIFKELSDKLAKTVTHVINSSTKQG